jgi:hypothetical protein
MDDKIDLAWTPKGETLWSIKDDGVKAPHTAAKKAVTMILDDVEGARSKIYIRYLEWNHRLGGYEIVGVGKLQLTNFP